jgi:DNA primase
MPGRIPQTFIDDLLARTDIVDIVDNFVSLRKGGKNFLGLCPFHDEKTPSFTVSQEKQFYHCFGCGANGTAISFLMDYNRMEFLEVIEDLASKAGLEVPHEGGQLSSNDGLTELYELMELIVRYYRTQLKDHPESKRAIDYLKNRGITGELASTFELGYAPPGWDNLITNFGASQEALNRLDKLGMIILRNTGGGYYDRFRDRIIYPIRDHRSRIIGFGGRTLGDDNPKYLNSPETPIFHKGRELYGLPQAKQLSKENQKIFVVEGYMDVLALAQFDIPNVVATLGVACTADHLNRLYRYVDQVIFCFDGDEAGKNAAWRAMEISLPFLQDGKQAFFIFMPDGIDPDDFVRQNGRDFFEDQANMVPLSDYLLNTLKTNIDLDNREGRSSFVDKATPYISMLPMGALRQMLMSDLAEMAKIPVKNIEPLVPEVKNTKRIQRFATKSMSSSGSRTPVTIIIEILLARPELARLIETPSELDEIPDPGVSFLREIVELIHSRPDVNCAGIIENWRGSKYENRLKQIAADSDERITALSDPEIELLNSLALLKKKRDIKSRQILPNKRPSELSDAERAQWLQAGNHLNKNPKK